MRMELVITLHGTFGKRCAMFQAVELASSTKTASSKTFSRMSSAICFFPS